MSEQIDNTENISTPEDDLLRVIVDKEIDNGLIIRGMQDQLRKIIVQNEKMEPLLLQMERLTQNGADMTRAVQENKKWLGAEISMLNDKVDGWGLKTHIEFLKKAIKEHIAFFEEPRVKLVEHRHIFKSSSILVFLGLALGFILFFVLWISQCQRAGDYAENDIKWRAARIMVVPGLPAALDSVQRAYDGDPYKLKITVESEENRLKQLGEAIMRERANQQEIEGLEKKK